MSKNELSIAIICVEAIISGMAGLKGTMQGADDESEEMWREILVDCGASQYKIWDDDTPWEDMNRLQDLRDKLIQEQRGGNR